MISRNQSVITYNLWKFANWKHVQIQSVFDFKFLHARELSRWMAAHFLEVVDGGPLLPDLKPWSPLFFRTKVRIWYFRTKVRIWFRTKVRKCINWSEIYRSLMKIKFNNYRLFRKNFFPNIYFGKLSKSTESDRYISDQKVRKWMAVNHTQPSYKYQARQKL